MSQSQFANFFVNQDIYGHAIGVNYRGSGTYKTKMGAFCTLATYVLIFVNLIMLVIAFNDGSMQNETLQRLELDRSSSDPFSFLEYNMELMFVVNNYIPPSIGTFRVEQRFGDKTIRELELTDCS